MITIYKDKKDIPDDMDYVELNDIFFNQNTVLKLDEKGTRVISDYEELKGWWNNEE